MTPRPATCQLSATPAPRPGCICPACSVTRHGVTAQAQDFAVSAYVNLTDHVREIARVRAANLPKK
jgi:hypothetical protein